VTDIKWRLSISKRPLPGEYNKPLDFIPWDREGKRNCLHPHLFIYLLVCIERFRDVVKRKSTAYGDLEEI
jgi:hypothetical protein